MKRISLALLLLLAVPASADVGSDSNAYPLSGTITTGNTYQTILPSAGGRRGCYLQNTTGHTMSLWLDTAANAAAAIAAGGVALSLTAGQTFNCGQFGPVIITNAISITTPNTGDAWTIWYQ